MINTKTLTYYKPTIAFFVGRCANQKVCARKKPLCEPEHLCLETHKKSNGGYNFSLVASVTRQRNK
jgi:hypothetical protein